MACRQSCSDVCQQNVINFSLQMGGVSSIDLNTDVCTSCGACVEVLKDGSLDPATWYNTGIGRINPNGSEGSRHSSSVEQARSPETYGKCHMGLDSSTY